MFAFELHNVRFHERGVCRGPTQSNISAVIIYMNIISAAFQRVSSTEAGAVEESRLQSASRANETEMFQMFLDCVQMIGTRARGLGLGWKMPDAGKVFGLVLSLGCSLRGPSCGQEGDVCVVFASEMFDQDRNF